MSLSRSESRNLNIESFVCFFVKVNNYFPAPNSVSLSPTVENEVIPKVREKYIVN